MDALKFVEHKDNAHWDYDGEADVLYIYFDKPKEAEGIDIGNGTIVRIDSTTNEVVGFIILNPIKRTLEQLKISSD